MALVQKTAQTAACAAGSSEIDTEGGAAAGAFLPRFCYRQCPFESTEQAMPQYRSRTTTHGRNMAGARALWRATGMKNDDFGKPIIAVAKSFTQFVPGHVSFFDSCLFVVRDFPRAGGVAKEFNTIAVDDGIAMGHGGMLYS